MKHRLKDRRGSVALLYFGMVFLLLMLTFLVIEMGSTMENYSYAESVLQRCCNSAVERNIDDAYRADRILCMDTNRAAADFRTFVQTDLPSKYRFTISSSKDFRKIALGITRTMKNRLRERLQTSGESIPPYIAERYGKSKQIRFVSGQALIPVGYVQTKAPHFKRRDVNQYTSKGRSAIHKNLETVNVGILHYLMRNPVQYASVELSSNRLALYCAQHGCCAVTNLPLEIGDIHCHHKKPRSQGGNDRYSNLILVSEAVHVLIHATSSEVIAYHMRTLNLNTKQKTKLNSLRKAVGLSSI